MSWAYPLSWKKMSINIKIKCVNFYVNFLIPDAKGTCGKEF